MTTCERCCNTGRVKEQQGFFTVERNCPLCHGGLISPNVAAATAAETFTEQMRTQIAAVVGTARFTPRAVENEFAPDPELIRHCEQLLEQARSGKLRAVAYGTVVHDGLVPAGEVNWGFYNAAGAGFALGESISRLRHAWDKDRDK